MLIKIIVKSLILLIIISVASCNLKQVWMGPIVKLVNDTYVTRAEWNAYVPKRVENDTHQPVKLIVLKHTNTPYCVRKLACSKSVKHLQKQHMLKGFNDIDYNFLFDPHGYVYEGLGWHNLNMDAYNPYHRSIGFIGPEGSELTVNQTQAVTDFIRGGLILQMLEKDFQFSGTTYLNKIMANIKSELHKELGMDDYEAELEVLREINNYKTDGLSELQDDSVNDGYIDSYENDKFY